ncbi:hypothetical protein MDAP_001950 [Mitosporidium daphniae]
MVRRSAAQAAAAIAEDKAAHKRQLMSLVHVLFTAVGTFFACGYIALNLFQLRVEYSLIVAILATAILVLIEGYLLANILLPPEPKMKAS